MDTHYVYIVYSERLDIYNKAYTQYPEKRLYEHKYLIWLFQHPEQI